MGYMFSGCENFNQDINNWDVSNVTNMYTMFKGAANFNQPLDKWNTSNLTGLADIFCDAFSFNQDLNSWKTEKVEYMNNAFFNASSFNQDNIKNWNFKKVKDFDNIFNDVSLDLILKIYSFQSSKSAISNLKKIIAE